MMSCKPLLMAGLLIVTTAGCISKQPYESRPVVLQTEHGPVTCQLYTHDQVLWDEAISAPAALTPSAADQVCIEEGRRILAQRQL